MQHFLEARNVVKRYAAHTALDGVSIALGEGRVFGLLGPNGAGKTTLIRIINRIAVADEGEVLIGGRPMMPEDIERIGYLPEERGLYKKMRVGEQAIYLARLKGMSERDAKRKLTEWFEKLGIMSWWNSKLEELSKGMQQKVQFVITLLHEPELLIFDEPFSGFDPVNAELLKREVLELRDKGHTILFSTHNMASVEEICDSIALIDHSRVVLEGEVGEVRRRFQDNTYEVVLPQEAKLAPTPLFDIAADAPHTAGTRRLVLHKREAALTNSALITEVARQAEILSFSENLPTMNDIFIKLVNTTAS